MFDLHMDLRNQKHADTDMDTYYDPPSAVFLSGDLHPSNFNNLISRLWRRTSDLLDIWCCLRL